ncbi:MAG TPA: exosortase/archaeosortase family protein [Candidatus Acidoferrum sp.]
MRSHSGMVSLNNTPDASARPRTALLSGSLPASRFLLSVLLLTLIAITLDQFFSPILYSSSPLWATATWVLLVWRRGETSFPPGNDQLHFSFSTPRVTAFFAAHLLIVFAARWFTEALQPLAGSVSLGGTLLAGMKLSVLAPTLALLPRVQWRRILSRYTAEAIAGLVVLITFFPRRTLESLWPWYGQVLGRFVYFLADLMVPGIAYIRSLTPTLTGPDLDVTIILDCSGINGFELFDLLFGLVVILDWNRLCKRRTFLSYFAGLFAMFLGNALRITSFVVLGNHGFAESITRVHIAAGWIFFSVVFLVYLCLTYGWMLNKKSASAEPQTVA